MRVLALDTATEACGVALVTEDRIELELSMAHGQTHARYLMKAVHNVLALACMELDAVDGFVVTRGPGSFTGLRIGMSAAKGLALATGKPLVGVSSLTVLAHQATAGGGLVCPILDARRNQVYWSVYRSKGSKLVSQAPERVGPVEDILRFVREPCVCIGNGALLYKKRLSEAALPGLFVAADEQHGLRAGVLGRIGCLRLMKGSGDEVHTLAPTYIRKSDAEIN